MMYGQGMHERHRKWHEASPERRALMVAAGIVVAAAGLAVVGLIVMLLWNQILSTVLGLPALRFWQALGLFILARLLFGGRGNSFLARMRMRRVMREHIAHPHDRGEEKGEQ